MSVCLYVCMSVRKSFSHFLLKGGFRPADHDGTIRIASKRPVRSQQAFLSQNSDFTEHLENRIVGAPHHGQSNGIYFWSHGRAIYEFSGKF